MNTSEAMPLVIPSRVDALVVGAGFAGLYMLHKLRRSGLRACILEAGDEVGGTWNWNRYPGARCDVESLEYSYSFDEDLQREWHWTERYATQPEILSYIHHVCDRFDLWPDIHLNARVSSAIFGDSEGRWRIETERGDIVFARYLIMATGCLSTPNVPVIKGQQNFEGDVYHTGKWPKTPVSFKGRRVGFIGTGSSGCQALPLIAEEAAKVFVFQRTANHCIPANNYPLSDEYQRRVKERYPELRAKWRSTPIGIGLPRGNRFALCVSEIERESLYQHRWDVGGGGFATTFEDLILDREANETAAEFIRKKIDTIVHDPRVAERLKPYGHAMGAKRLCLVTNYYETFNLDHVQLISTRETPIEEITSDAIRTRDHEYKIDCLVYATGFDAMTGAMLAINIRGRNGRALREAWADRPNTYLGLMIAGFPNLFTITGPGSPSVLSNVIVSIEQHVEWIANCISYLRDSGKDTIEASEDEQAAWMTHVDRIANLTLYPTAKSWYTGANIDGKPSGFSIYVGGTSTYAAELERVVSAGYKGFIIGSHEPSVECSVLAVAS